MIFQVGERIVALDLVSRPDVFADLHPPLVQGYCLDAIRAPGEAAVDGNTVGEAFIASATGTRILEGDGIGLGRDFRFESNDLVGSGLVCGDELIQLSVFASTPDENDSAARPTRRTRISRPSRRRS